MTTTEPEFLPCEHDATHLDVCDPGIRYCLACGGLIGRPTNTGCTITRQGELFGHLVDASAWWNTEADRGTFVGSK